MAIRLYHLASELDVASSELLSLLGKRGMQVPSVMSVLDDTDADKARQVATGRLEIEEKPAPGTAEIKLPPPVVPAPARPIHPVSRPGAPGQRRYPAQQRQSPRRGIKIFRQKETRQRSREDKQRAEEILSNRTIPVTVPLSIKEFSQEIGVKASRLLLHLMKQGIMANPNTSLDEEMVMVLAEAFNRTVDIQTAQTVEDKLDELIETHESGNGEAQIARPPVVAVLGHVDHGKTSLLDYIRKSRVAAGEAGGITQHIGAYQVAAGKKKKYKRKITFLDTPGHEAFTAMRARGAQLTDIVILIVAAEDGVMPQTEEALAHAQAAGCPVVVAINKCDKPDANPDKVRQQLASAGLQPEEWGGETGMIPVSATTGLGIEDLLERIALEAELLDLKGSPDKPAEGYVVEARKQTGRGVVGTVLVKDGTLHKGDFVLSGACQGKVKSLTNDKGKTVDKAPPATPVEITGLDEVPEAGARFQVIHDKNLAKKVAADRSHRQREKEIASKQSTSNRERLMHRIGESSVHELRVVLKADVKGSVEALRAKVEEIGNEEVRVKLLHAAVGGITESDVLLAQASEALVVGFHVAADAKARTTADQAGVEIRTYQIIYELLEDLTRLAEGLLPSETEEVVVGHVEIRALFKHRKRNIAGGMVTDGFARRDAKVRLIRDGRVIYSGELESLRRFKDDAKEVKEGFECGVMIAGYDDIKEGDIIEFYVLEERTRTL